MIMENKEKKILVTHNGTFHSDDIFACATLSLFLEKNNQEFEIIRTRDENIINRADYVFDVGGVYNKEKNRFDHHQIGGAGKHDDGIEYASFGLVWEKFGNEVCNSEKIAKKINLKLVEAVDSHDNGISLTKNNFDISPYTIQDVFNSMRKTWKEDADFNNEMFLKCVSFAKEILKREIKQVQDYLLAEEKVKEIYENTKDKRIIVLDDNYPFGEVLFEFPEPIYVVRPRDNDHTWGIDCMRKEKRSFMNRKDLPFSWSGLRDEEFQKVTGVNDAVFCHRALFLAVAKSKEGAIKLAQLALENN